MSFAKQSIFYREMNDTNLNFYLYKINVKAEGFIFNFWRIRPPLLFGQGVKNFSIFLGCYLLVGQGMSLIIMWIDMHWWRLFLWCHNDQICGIFVFHLIFELNVIMSITVYIFSCLLLCKDIFFCELFRTSVWVWYKKKLTSKNKMEVYNSTTKW